MVVVHTDWRPSTSLIKVYDQNLTEDFCKHCIDLFEKDDRKSPGRTGRGVVPHIKDSIDLLITDRSGWEEVDILFHAALKEPAQDMFDLLSDYTQLVIEPRDSGYQIQRTAPNGGYSWHNDYYVYSDGYERLFTYIWYLNTVSEGGETEFLDQKIQPIVGRLVLFPATWTFLHRGLPPKTGFKYICTGWMASAPSP